MWPLGFTSPTPHGASARLTATFDLSTARNGGHALRSVVPVVLAVAVQLCGVGLVSETPSVYGCGPDIGPFAVSTLALKLKSKMPFGFRFPHWPVFPFKGESRSRKASVLCLTGQRLTLSIMHLARLLINPFPKNNAFFTGERFDDRLQVGHFGFGHLAC